MKLWSPAEVIILIIDGDKAPEKDRQWLLHPEHENIILCPKNFATEPLEVRYAAGTESYLAFSGETEHPDAHEVIFADGAGNAHARRWTNRQSALSAVRDETASVLIVAEAMHGSASADVPKLIAAIADELASVWSVASRTAILDQQSPRFEF